MCYILTGNVCPPRRSVIEMNEKGAELLLYGIMVAVHLQLLLQPSFHHQQWKKRGMFAPLWSAHCDRMSRVWLCVFFPPNTWKWSSSFPFFHGILLLGNCLYAQEFQSADGNGSAKPTHLHLLSVKATVIRWLIMRWCFFSKYRNINIFLVPHYYIYGIGAFRILLKQKKSLKASPQALMQI